VPVRQPSRVTWLVIGGVAALIVVAVADALRSSGSETARPAAAASSTNEASPPAPAPTTEEKASLSPRQGVEQAGNEWARLFAGDRHWPAPGTCEHMTQPACERMSCERVDGSEMRNCTRPSWQFRRSFADATVVAIVINGEQAAARFSNGETVRMEIGGNGFWWIHRFGGNAGRDLFEPPS
jgi:hypothetical protein